MMDEVKKLKYQTLGIVAGLVGLVVVVYVFVARGSAGGFGADELQRYEEVYMNLPDQPPSPLWRRGRVLVMAPQDSGSDSPAIHDAHWQLPEDMRATLGHVDTVITVTSKSVPVGNYTNGAVAYRSDVTLTAFDAETGKSMGRRTIRGGPPGQIPKVQVMSGTGSVDVKKIVVELPTSRPSAKG